MATILLTGATGTLGSALLSRPARLGHRIRAAARRVAGRTEEGVEWKRVDLRTGEGLDTALAGIDVVVHAASAPKGEAERTEVTGTQRLLDAATRARVRHVIYVSIVGVDRIPIDYYRYKLAAEERMRTHRVPWTIVRGTQFHELIDVWCRGLARSPVAVAPRGWKVQPIHAAEFADALWQRVELGPARHAPDVAGPEVLEWTDVLAAWHRARNRERRVVGVPIPGRLSRLMRDGVACAPAHATGVLTWTDWLARHYGAGA